MNFSPVHFPVMWTEVMEWLNIQPCGIYVDMTVGAAGHSSGILKKLTPEGFLIGIDQDEEILKIADQQLQLYGKNYSLQHSHFSAIAEVLQKLKISQVNGVLWDLGISSYQLQQSRRGFSFQQEGPLDMRMNPKNAARTAADIINSCTQQELADIFFQYGEEVHSRKIAQAICEYRKNKPIKSTLELANLINNLAGNPPHYPGRIHPATKVFQALRIAVNSELDELKISLETIIPFLAPDARIVVISFHSLEDRIVKQFFKQREDLEILTNKPILPSHQEERQNPRSRSAKLRCSKKI